MEDNIFDKIEEVDLKKKMEESYIDYAMSVIAAQSPPGRPRRLKAGTETCSVLHDRVK